MSYRQAGQVRHYICDAEADLASIIDPRIGSFATCEAEDSQWFYGASGWTQTSSAGGGGSGSLLTPATVVATGAIVSSGLQTIDGILLVDGNRVLAPLGLDSGGTATGIYVAHAGAWTTATDSPGSAGQEITVARGTLFGGSKWAWGGELGDGAPRLVAPPSGNGWGTYITGNYLHTEITSRAIDTGNPVVGLLIGHPGIAAIGTPRLNGIADPSASTDAATKNYVDALAPGAPGTQTFQSPTTPPVSGNVYQNTTSVDWACSLRAVMAVNPVLASDMKVEISPNNFGSAQTWADPAYAAGALAVGSDAEYIGFPVPKGWYYKVTATNSTIGALVAIG